MARRRRTGAAEDLIELISLLPWWAGVALALVSYIGLHAWALRLTAAVTVAPTLSNAVMSPLVQLGQYALPVMCLVGAIVSGWRRYQRKSLADKVSSSKTADVLGDMSWREFEMLVGEGFRRRGYQVVEIGGSGPDGGVDLVLRKDGEKNLVQCKQWRAYKVSVQVVRELYGVMAASGAAGGFVVTSGRFTDDARKFAEGRNVRLLDGDALFQLIRSVRDASPMNSGSAESMPRPSRPEGAPEAPFCPRCSSPMVRRTARRGTHVGESFWGCSAFPSCRGRA